MEKQAGRVVNKTLTTAALVLVGVGVVWLWRRGVGGVAEDTAKAATNVVTGVAAGVVKGTGEVVGIPDTDAALCRQALAAGDYWNASFYCPAKEFIAAGGSAFYEWFRPDQRPY